MTLSVVAKFLFGRSDAIRTVASNRAAFLTGLLLVLLTAVARNYDQTFILEKPFLWLFGSLMFSVFSGTWVFMVAYSIAWGYMGAERPRLWSGWPAFMGLFWMTAPIAWLYAIPVERLFDSLTAARANVVLLAIVSVWRVLLMARVIQVLHGAPFFMALAWVLIPATVEVLGISVFGGGLSKRIMAGMMGMRNSPEEEILLRSISTASGAALCILPIAVLVTVGWRMKSATDPLPARTPGRVPSLPIGIAALFWFSVAIVPQCELLRNFTLETMLAKGEFRHALDYMSAHSPSEFAPARTLPPKPFEAEVFQQVPPLLAAVKPSDAPWVHEHLLRRLTQMYDHISHGWYISPTNTPSREELITQINQGIQWADRFAPLGGAESHSILSGLEKIVGGESWRSTNELFLAALARHATEAPVSFVSDGRSTTPEDVQRANWNLVLTDLARIGITNSAGGSTLKTQR